MRRRVRRSRVIYDSHATMRHKSSSLLLLSRCRTSIISRRTQALHGGEAEAVTSVRHYRRLLSTALQTRDVRDCR